MNKKIQRRVIEEANIIINTGITIRDLSRRLGISKSTIYKDIKLYLINIDKSLYNKVQKTLKKIPKNEILY